MKPLLLLFAALGGTALHAVTINWSTVQLNSGTVSAPGSVLNAPNGAAATINPFASLTATQFVDPTTYNDAAFAAFLGLTALPQFNVVVFAFNDTASPFNWEGTNFTFQDGVNTATMLVTTGSASGTPNYVTAGGFVSTSAYQSFFGMAPAGAGSVPFLLIDLSPSGVNVNPSMTIRMEGFNGSIPNPDAVGILTPGNQGPETPEPASMGLIGAGLVAAGCLRRKRC